MKLLLGGCLAAALFLLPAQPAQPPEPKPVMLEGTVTQLGGQIPVRKAKIAVYSFAATETTAQGETDDAGKFSIKDIKPGRYRIVAEKAGFQRTAYGYKGRDYESGTLLQVLPGTDMSGLSIAMPRHGVLAGKILDNENEPVSRSLVLALATAYNSGQKTRLPAGAVPVMSDDLGQYRIGQLPPGRYIVCALPIEFTNPLLAGDTKPGPEMSIPTCYPGVTDQDQASSIEIRDGAEVPGIDIRLTKSKAITVKGKISGLPANAGMASILSLTAKDSGPLGPSFAPKAILQGGDGKFEIRGVTPGSYILQSVPAAGSLSYIVRMPIEITDQSITDLDVPALTPFEIKTQLVADADAKLAGVRVVIVPADGIISALGMGTTDEKGAATIGSLAPGRYGVRVQSLPQGYYVKSLKMNEQAAPAEEVDIATAGSTLSILVGRGAANYSGIVRDEKGQPVPGAYVTMIPVPRNAFRNRTTRADQNGTYQIGSLPPGEYRALAFEVLEGGIVENEEFQKLYLPKAKRVQAEEGARVSFDLTLTKREN